MLPSLKIPALGCGYSLSRRRILSSDATFLPSDVGIGSNPFAELVALYIRDEFLSKELSSLNRRLVSARTYLESPVSNHTFAVANLRHLRSKHGAVLTMLRANRREAESLIRSLESPSDDVGNQRHPE